MAAQLLKGTAFITGAATGIGQATAHAFAKHGIKNLALADINTNLLASTSAAIEAANPGVQVLQLQMDVRNRIDVKKSIDETVAKFGRLDVALNNAGLGGSGNQTHEVEDEEWDKVLGVDLHGVRNCQKEELRVMLQQENLGPRIGRGNIINLASMLGLIVPSNSMHHTAYATAKHGVLGLTKGDANSYGAQGIRINAMCPGYIKTPLMETVMELGPDTPLGKDVARTPLGRLGLLEEVADAVVFLASPMSSFMQGAGLVADGGFSTS